MSVPIHQDPDPEPVLPKERCCICRSPTSYWTSLPTRKLGAQVALCLQCAARADPKDIPTKKAWIRREHIAYRPTIGDIATGRDRNYPPAPIVPPHDA